MANAKSPECNSISTTEVAIIDITKGGFNGLNLVREASIPLSGWTSSSIVLSQVARGRPTGLLQSVGGLRAAAMTRW